MAVMLLKESVWNALSEGTKKAIMQEGDRVEFIEEGKR